MKFTVSFIGKRIHEGMLRHGLVKGGIKNRNLRGVRGMLHCNTDARKVGRVMKRGKGHQPLNGFNNCLVNQNRLMELFTAVHYPVAYCLNLADI